MAKLLKVRNVIDGRETTMTEDCFKRQMQKLHNGTLYDNNGWEIIASAPKVSEGAAKQIEKTKADAKSEKGADDKPAK